MSEYPNPPSTEELLSDIDKIKAGINVSDLIIKSDYQEEVLNTLRSIDRKLDTLIRAVKDVQRTI